MRDRRSIVAAAFIAAVGVALAGQADDPRGDQACLAVHGARLPFGVRTVEDVIARRGRARPAFHCSLQAPFGRFVNVIGSSQPWFYLEIPKAGSTSMKRWIGQFTNQLNKPRTLKQKLPIRQSFTVVREPLNRFLSAYGTVRHRAKPKYPFNNTRLSESERFERFVDLLAAKGDHLAMEHTDEGCIWYHPFSQLWFFELLDQPVTRILRLEKIETDLAEFLNETHLAGTNPSGAKRRGAKSSVPLTLQGYLSVPKKNAMEGGFDPRTLRMSSPMGIRKALRYLAQDYACLGYPIPT